mmetsp:Transcript_109119/g.213783  ORF Transcript_109119/g.213783 Transcript_109119/m.213783 type:complete len:221 (+) Transcript_109119:2528-3190(+)
MEPLRRVFSWNYPSWKQSLIRSNRMLRRKLLPNWSLSTSRIRWIFARNSCKRWPMLYLYMLTLPLCSVCRTVPGDLKRKSSWLTRTGLKKRNVGAKRRSSASARSLSSACVNNTRKKYGESLRSLRVKRRKRKLNTSSRRRNLRDKKRNTSASSRMKWARWTKPLRPTLCRVLRRNKPLCWNSSTTIARPRSLNWLIASIVVARTPWVVYRLVYLRSSSL